MDFVWFAFAGLSFALSLVVVLLKRTASTQRDDLHAIQSAHQRPTSRFGGLAVFATFVMALLIEPTRANPHIFLNLVCVLPVLAVGFAEDAGWRIAPRWRLFAAIIGSLLAIFVCGAVIERLGFLRMDFVLEQQVVAVLLTVLALTGVTHSFNLLDGLHGLCGFTAIIVAVALAVISSRGGQYEMGLVLALLVAALVGFLMVNFPRGLLFLGDAGATGIGFILASSAVQLLQVMPNLSPWALALVFFWPIADTLWTITRRMSRRSAAMRPDRMHFHHVVMRAFEILVLRKKNRAVSNPVATAVLLPFIATPSIVGVLFCERDDLALIATLIFATVFLVGYRALVRAAQNRVRVVFVNTPRSNAPLGGRGGVAE